jgi:hypothetical protein
MKNLISTLGVLLISLVSNAQLVVNQTVTPSSNVKVGDTVTVKYTVTRGATTPRYFWLRYQFNNKALALVPNSTVFTQGTSVQTYFTSWNNYRFTPSATVSDTSLYAQYQVSPWAYAVNADWNVGQLTIQRADASINGDIVTQKYVIKDLGSYSNIHRLDLAHAINDASAFISPITRSSTNVSLTNVTGNTSQFKVRVLFPSGYNITDHNVQLMRLKTDGTGDIDWSQQPIAQLALDASGEATFTTQVKVGDSLGVFVSPASSKAWMNNVITVSDAYKAFLGHSQTDISGNTTFFTRPVLERKIGNVTKNDMTFNESDAYYSFAYVMGQDVSSQAFIPTNTATSWRWHSGLLNQSWLDGVTKNRVYITTPTQTVDAVFAWGGDLDWSHSSHPDTIATRITQGIFTNSANIGTSTLTSENIKSMAITSTMSNSYEASKVEQANLNIISTIENGKVTLSCKLTKADLAGLQVVMNYDSTKLTLDNVIFDAGSTITNFSTKDDGRLTFGSIDQLKTARIKTGTPYKLIFTPKTPVSNTAGLFFFVLADAVDATGKKVELVVE